MSSQLVETSEILLKAAQDRDQEPNKVIEALLQAEKAARQSKDEATNMEMLSKLTGNWRLVFTTGEKNVQDAVGKINYFPIKAVQQFDIEKSYIQNGVYLGPLSLVFSGDLQLNPKLRKLEFNFDRLALGPLSFGIGGKSVKDLEPKDVPFFSWIQVTEEYAVARGRGGGLALWLRTEEA
mmetsp:Transcript_11853/g.18602  ORF Transcript_11853/g.18602 Transcript_11853/m.18602 type:complete len:180 (+) Transcript_11853:118-657(+)|eukprot:CAMPEP_0184300228 /NCGR_PEP_ID=MMETSP1049-20130417/10684_1 /TAXON_ID=77928 /ORGANISM="Proteomonas sulcata, Strain CCMP704" /LENGTH=179 /DNA_ID=CAMNT_0026610891 /DNA_START=90 /DNA_END=629 /DNA_ORIENTATION=+